MPAQSVCKYFCLARQPCSKYYDLNLSTLGGGHNSPASRTNAPDRALPFVRPLLQPWRCSTSKCVFCSGLCFGGVP